MYNGWEQLNKLLLPMEASLEERSSCFCFCTFRALPFFDFVDETGDISKSLSELDSESSCCDFRFLREECLSGLLTGESLSCGVLCEEVPPLRARLLDTSFLSSAESTSEFAGELGGFGCCSLLLVVLCEEDPPLRARLLDTSRLSSAESTSEFAGELGGFVCCSLLLVVVECSCSRLVEGIGVLFLASAELSDIERLRSTDGRVFLFCF